MAEDIVIGSGPAGVAAATALIDQGRDVLMLDVGERLEAENDASRRRLGSVEPESWDPDDVALLRTAPDLENADEIRRFGSDFMFRDPTGFFGPEGPPEWLGLKPSYATGGLSNGWGASIMPYRLEDLTEWPAGARDLAPHYENIRKIIPIAARRDRLTDLFPMQAIEEDRTLPLSAQAKNLLDRLASRQDKHETSGVYFGRARQAVSPNCRTCSMCLYGCPYGLIFNSAHIVEKLRESGRFTYLPGRHAIRFLEDETTVRVWSNIPGSDDIVDETAERLFIAAGVLPTTRLVLRSLGRPNASVTLNDSTHFLMPMLHAWSPGIDPAEEAKHTLTEVFLEITDPAVSAGTVHTQLYTFNDLYAADMRRRFGVFKSLFDPVIESLSRRLIVAQGFLHSDLSPKVRIRLMDGGEHGRMTFEAIHNPETQGAIRRVKRKLGRVLRSAGVFPLPGLTRVGPIGSSFHAGGTFPMRQSPNGLESDLLGRPAGLQRVHIVDASVFPSIPATTITLSVMANAYRIGAEAAALP